MKLDETTIRGELTKLFAKVEPQFRKDQIARYRRNAEQELATWLEKLKGEPKTRKDGWGYYEYNRPGRYVKVTWPEGLWESSIESKQWEEYRQVRDAGGYTVDYEKAEKDANRAVDDAKSHFLNKQTMKLLSACKGRAKLKTLSGELLWAVGVIEGHLRLTFSNGDAFTLTMRVITNCRYSPQYKTFYQFPSRFTAIVLNKEDCGGKSEEWMAEHFAQ